MTLREDWSSFTQDVAEAITTWKLGEDVHDAFSNKSLSKRKFLARCGYCGVGITAAIVDFYHRHFDHQPPEGNKVTCPKCSNPLSVDDIDYQGSLQ